MTLTIVSALTLVSGCDTVSGVTRDSEVHVMPNLMAVKERIESYPEVKEVKFWQRKGGRPITLTGLREADESFFLSYTDRLNVHGTLCFNQDHQGEVTYSQSLIDINRSPPQSWIDATWPVMKKIELDLIEEFGLREICDTLRVRIIRVDDPERIVPDKR